jgi:hypothetical protein
VSDGSQVGGRQRALFMSVNDPPVLSLEGVRESDAGMYVCRVDFRISPTKYTKVNLTVIGEYNILDLFFQNKCQFFHSLMPDI